MVEPAVPVPFSSGKVSFERLPVDRSIGAFPTSSVAVKMTGLHGGWVSTVTLTTVEEVTTLPAASVAETVNWWMRSLSA